AKRTNDSIFSTPGTLLSAALPSRSRNLSKLYGSGNAAASPPENQRDHEQHKEYKEQKFCDAPLGLAATLRSKLPPEQIVNFMPIVDLKNWIEQLRPHAA